MRSDSRAFDLPPLYEAILRIGARWVPRLRRDAWLREWRAELAWAWHGSGHRPLGPARKLRLLVRVLWSWMDALWVCKEEISMNRIAADFRIAVRNLRRNPGFTLVTVLTLALGIGANTAIFSIVNGVLIEPLPYPEPDRVVSVNFSAPGLGYPLVPFSDGLYFTVTEQQHSFDAVGMYTQDNVNLVGDGEPERVASALMTPTVFDALRTTPLEGRLFTAEDSAPGADPVALLSEEIWTTRYAADPKIVGRSLQLDGEMRRVVGILPSDFDFPSPRTRIWKPFPLDPSTASVGAFSYPGIGRLAAAATVESANTDLASILGRLGEIFPDELPPSILEQAQFAPRVEPYKDLIVGDVRRPLLVILGTVGLVLLIACANVANLFLVRAEARQREVTLRAALGASRGELARLFLTESLLLATIGGIGGIGLALVGLRAFTKMAPVAIPRMSEVGIDLRVLGFTAAVSAVAGLLFGAVPVLRTHLRDLATALREGGRTATASGGPFHPRNLLVVVQVSLALVLLVGSGLMMRSFQRLRTVDPGVDPAGVLTLQVALPSAEYPTAGERQTFWRDVLARARAVPGVDVAGAINHLPLDDARSNGSVQIEDHPVEEGALPPLAEKKRVLPGAFEALGVGLLEGRTLDEGDSATTTRAVVVSRGFARHWWPDESPLGRRLREDSNDDWYEIVGVVEDVHFSSIEEPAEETVYYPALAGPIDSPEFSGFMSLVVRTDSGDPTSLAGPLRQAIWDVDPRQPISNMRPLEQLVDESMSRTSFTVVMLGIASAMAVLLGAIGIYGVISYLVSQRTAEIGVRLALGAPAVSVRRMVVRRGLALAAVGILVGLLAAVGTSRALATLLYEVSATDPTTYVAVAGLVTLTALLASWIPAVRASSVDPLVALRSE